MMLIIILIVVLVIALAASLPVWRYSEKWGYFPMGVIGLIIVIGLILVLERR